MKPTKQKATFLATHQQRQANKETGKSNSSMNQLPWVHWI
jgi:hypothetical protein